MLIRIPQVLSADEVLEIRRLLSSGDWVDGRKTAGAQALHAKLNEQLSQEGELARALQARVLQALNHSALFFSATLPKRIYPPQFNRYGGHSNTYGKHVDGAVMYVKGTGERVRSDVSCTLFLSQPEEYEGGELVVDDTYGSQRIKLAAGDLVIYPSTSVHRVDPVTSGHRVASFFWVESMVRSDEQRRLLFDMDMALLTLRQTHGESESAVSLTGTYHNLLRMWADT